MTAGVGSPRIKWNNLDATKHADEASAKSWSFWILVFFNCICCLILAAWTIYRINVEDYIPKVDLDSLPDPVGGIF